MRLGRRDTGQVQEQMIPQVARSLVPSTPQTRHPQEDTAYAQTPSVQPTRSPVALNMIRKDQTELAKLQISNQMDSATMTHHLQSWFQNVSLTLATWCDEAPEFWEEALHETRRQHEEW
eukprot:2680546-Amphidinium_carterae.1